MGWTYPTEEKEGSCVLCVPVHLVPLVAYAFRDAQQRYKWESDTDWTEGYYAFACLLGGLMNGCDIGESIKELNVLMAHALGLRDDASVSEIEQFLPATGAALAAAEQADSNGRLPTLSRLARQSDLLDLRGTPPNEWYDWLNITEERHMTLYDLYRIQSAGDEIKINVDGEEKTLWDYLSDTIGTGSDVIDIITDIAGATVEAGAEVAGAAVEGTIGTAQLIVQAGLLAAITAHSAQLTQISQNQAALASNLDIYRLNREAQIDAVLTVLSGNATGIIGDSIIEALRGSTIASSTRNVIDAIEGIGSAPGGGSSAGIETRLDIINKRVESFQKAFEATDFCCDPDDIDIEPPPEPIPTLPELDIWCQRAQWYVDRAGAFLTFISYAIEYPSLWTLNSIKKQWEIIFETKIDNVWATYMQDLITDNSLQTPFLLPDAYDAEKDTFVCVVYSGGTPSDATENWLNAVINLYPSYSDEQKELLQAVGVHAKTLAELWDGSIPASAADLDPYDAYCELCFAMDLPLWSGTALFGAAASSNGATVWRVDGGVCTPLRTGLPGSTTAVVDRIHVNPLRASEWVVRVNDQNSISWWRTGDGGNNFASLGLTDEQDMVYFAWSRTDESVWAGSPNNGAKYWSGIGSLVLQDAQIYNYGHSGTEWEIQDGTPNIAEVGHTGDRFVFSADDLPGTGTGGGVFYANRSTNGTLGMFGADPLYNTVADGLGSPLQMHLSRGYQVLAIGQSGGSEFWLLNYQEQSKSSTGITPPAGGPLNRIYAGMTVENGEPVVWVWGFPDTLYRIDDPFGIPSLGATSNGAAAVGSGVSITDTYGVSDVTVRNAAAWCAEIPPNPGSVGDHVVAVVRNVDEVAQTETWQLILGCAAMSSTGGRAIGGLSGAIALVPQGGGGV